MSHSRSSRVSAFQAYSSHSPSGSRHSKQEKSYGSHHRSDRREISRKREYDRDRYEADEEGYKPCRSAPKSLMSVSHKSRASHSHEKSGAKRRHEAPSLLDIDFGARDMSYNVRQTYSTKSGEDSSYYRSDNHHQSDWKRRQDSQRSDSDEDWNHSGKSSKGRREWRDSSSHHSSNPNAPLIIDTAHRNYSRQVKGRSSDTDFEPTSLLGSYAPPPTRQPISLLELPDVGNGRPRLKPQVRDRPREIDRRKNTQVMKGKPLQQTTQLHQVTAGTEVSDGEGSPAKKSKSNKSDEIQKEAKQETPNSNANRLTVYSGAKYTVLAIPSSITAVGLHGRVRITPVLGALSILGCRLDKGKPYDVYSPLTGGLLSLYVVEDVRFTADDVREELTKYGISENDIKLGNLSDNSVSILLLEKSESVVCDYVSTFVPFTQLFNPVLAREEGHAQGSQKGLLLAKLGLKVAPPEEMTPFCLNMSQDYQEVLDRWKKKLISDDGKVPVILTCGAKNSGKSTFNRMIINSSLKSVEAIAYLEFDIGQTEFSPPATVSLHVIREPILGPPFSHQRHAERMVFYGDVTPTTDPSLYVKALRFVYEGYKELCPNVPLIVNTMGFPEGLGLMLLTDMVNLVKPDYVVQIDGYHQAANLPAVTQEMVALQEGWTYNKTPVDDRKQKVEDTHPHELILLMTLCANRRDNLVKLKPVDLRNLSLLASLSLGLERGMTLTSMPPYVVPYTQLGIHVCHHNVVPSEILRAIDASVVGLCVADLEQCDKPSEDSPFVFKEMPVCECLGLGLVRAVDVERGVLYIVTTLPKSHLRRMNTLMKGALTLPDQLILKQKSDTSLPYVDALSASTAVTSVRPRSRMPRLSLGANN